MSTELVVVRHGETVWHAENRYAGRSDVELTDTGLAQAAELGAWASTADLVGLFCSPLRRSRRTALAVTERTGIQPVVDERLTELDFGAGEGLTSAEMAQQLGAARDRFVADPVAHHLPGGEDPVLAARRGLAGLVAAAETAPGGRVLVVAHNTLLRLVLCEVLGIPLSRYRRAFPSVGNCRGARLRYRDGEFGLLALNEPLTSTSNR
ncbi:histidine phosphatase family protein [Goodfellowiella coeruleoviolacea]|nr:histidine phosphatase family protein [Goodfellowiella coeruleoviolacea]